MDGILKLGPLMIATDRALALVAIWAFLTIATLVTAQTGRNVGRAAWIAVAVGIVAARIGFILENLPAFLTEPWTMLALWQGGFSSWIGVGAAAATLLAMLRRQRATGFMIVSLAGLALTHSAVTAATAPSIKAFPSGISLATTTGQVLSLDAMRGKPFVLNLWATWCPPCRREMPMLLDVAKGSRTPILLVNQGEPAGRVRSFLSINDMGSDAVALDADQRVSAATGARAYPTTLFIDAGGRIVRIHSGEISRAALSAAIRDLERTPT